MLNRAPQLRRSDMSGSTGIPDFYSTPSDNDRHLLLVFSITQHPVHGTGILRHLKVFKVHALPLVVLTGLRSVRSGIFPEYQYFLLHISSFIWIT